MSNAGSKGKTLLGQLLYGARQIIIRFTQISMDVESANALVGTPLTEITPVNDVNSTVKTYTQPDLSGIFIVSETYGNIDLPNVLSSLTVSYISGGGDGNYTETASAAASGTAWSVGASVSGTAQATASCIPKLLYQIDTPVTTNVTLINCFFYSPTLDQTTILAILTAKLGHTVSAWPVFKVKPITVTLIGSKMNGSIRADYQGSASNSSSGVTLTQSDGLGDQYDFTPIIEQQQFPPTLHGSFTLTGSGSVSHAGTTTVTLSGGVISGGGSGTATATASASVSPTNISTTVPSSLPTSGLYLYRLDPGDSTTFGNYFIHATVFDFASIQ